MVSRLTSVGTYVLEVKKSKNIDLIVLIGLVFGQVLLVGHQVRANSGQSRVQYWSAALLIPIQHGAGAVHAVLDQALSRYVWLVGAEEEKREVDAESDRLRMENHFLRQKLLRHESRASLEAYSADLRSAALPARVIAHGPGWSSREVFLDRGRGDGLRPGMPVLTSDGIAGKVVAVQETTSAVLLISDENAGAGVVLGRSGNPGVLRGTGRRTCTVEYVGRDVHIVPGEFVHTSGLDGIYPGGLPVGQVLSVDTSGATLRAEVRPFVDLDRLSEVLVILEGTHEMLPPEVQESLREVAGARPGRDRGLAAQSLPTHADRLKQAYRERVASQGTSVGARSDGSGVPDLEAVSTGLRAYGSRAADNQRERR